MTLQPAQVCIASLRAAPAASLKNVDVSQLSNNESEDTIAVNPLNPDNIVIVTNVVVPAAGMSGR